MTRLTAGFVLSNRPRLRTLLAVALLASAAHGTAPAPGHSAAPPVATDARAALFHAPGFPAVDAPELPPALLEAALAGLPVDTLGSVEELRRRLQPGDYDVLVLPYGSAFPLVAWPEIRAFVEAGGSLAVLGGAPFHQPVHGSRAGEWRLGIRQPTFAHHFLIGPAEPVAATDLEVAFPAPSWELPVEGAETVWALTVRLGTRSDLPGEHGSQAYRDAVLRPLVHLVDDDGVPRACPLLEIDRLRGAEAGARWVFAPSDAPLTAPLVRAIVVRALEGASEVAAGPVHASVEPGEAPAIRVAVRRPVVRVGEEVPDRARLVVRDADGREVHRGEVELAGLPEARHGVGRLPPGLSSTPGLYRVEVTVPEAPWRPRTTTTGFWVRDADLLARGPRVTVSRDWLRRDEAVFPVLGVTYMASDVHRKFLFEPDPHVWDRDFARMASLGVDFVRTGLWTGWSRAMLDPGAIDEGFLRALDAYVQGAARHGIVVNFTFFAFLPPAYGGANPYLDPRSLEGQQELLTLVARRYRGVGWIHWDLINEPSYAPPEALWTTRPIGDRWERRAWREWVLARHGTDLAILRDRWRDAGAGAPEAAGPTDVLELPRPDELSYSMIREDRRPRKARDFVHFSQEVVAGWAARLRETLRTAGGDVLVTLGQDEGGTWTRSSQQLHAEAIDYTAVHPWWQNDDLLATGVAAKVPEKPNLFQETGLMRLEDVDGWPWRSPELAADLLERKYAYAFASRGAGVIEWAWNINPYMAIDNESVIGFFRPDGTAKPELSAQTELAAFFAAAAPWLDDFEPAPVVVVVPHSRLFAGRPAATDGLRRMIRGLSERFGVVPAALSELRLTPERLADARLVVVPSVEMLEGEAAAALLAAARAGTKVLITGAVTGDPYGELPPDLEALGVVDPGRPVRLREATGWGADGGDDRWATFDRNLRENLRRSLAPPLETLAGEIWHEPLPLEHAREEEPLVGLLTAALAAAGVETHPAPAGVAASLLHAPRAVLVVCVNETAEDARRTVTVAGWPLEIPVVAGRSRLVLVERASGRVIAATPGAPVGP